VVVATLSKGGIEAGAVVALDVRSLPSSSGEYLSVDISAAKTSTTLGYSIGVKE
jgi:hypothetical protein